MQIFRWFFDDLSRKRRSEPIWISKKLWPAGVWFARKKSFFVVGISFPVARMSLLHACIILLVWVNTKIECRGQNCVLFWLDFVTNPRISLLLDRCTTLFVLSIANSDSSLFECLAAFKSVKLIEITPKCTVLSLAMLYLAESIALPTIPSL